ncbi:MAG TPA: ATP-binding protein [Anaeromyxobacter sp.]|nr:ATP-binding protein [Anaeromyxobacter sp.]
MASPLAVHDLELDPLRQGVLRSGLTMAAIVLPTIAAVILVQILLRGAIDATGIWLCGYALAFPALRVVAARLPYRAGAAAFLALLGLLGLLVQLRAGFNAGSMAIFLVVVVLSGVFFGRRGALAALAISVAGSGVDGALVLGRHVPPIQAEMWSPEVAESWIRGAVVLALFGGSAAFAVVHVLRRLEREAADVRRALERERAERAAREAAEAERERARAALAAAQRMESLGRMAGAVAHDFNNLLSVILGCASTLQAELRERADPAAADAEQIGEAAERASAFTRQLLAFARSELVTPAAVDVAAVVRGSEHLLRRLAGEKVELVVDLDGEPVPALCDRGQLEQVLLNLVVNARDAMPDGGRVTIQAGRAEGRPGPATRCAEVRLAVRDTGTGMTPEVRERAFEPFFTTKAAGGGSGLGLATVYGIVRHSGGHIRLESEVGRGTLVEILLPRADGAPAG